MADEEDTREVLFPDWEGPDKTGLTIEQTGGEIFVKEVKGESPAARSGKVYEGDQIVGATVYFDNMSSEETAELLKTLNRHKVGLKLQNKGDKSPCCSPLSTPCRSPIGTLTWEGKTRFGGSSPDIILSGDDEDYKRIYTKKIKPRLKSEDLAEGVDVRTERHSSTSSDGSTITTITRRITTYTVDMPSGISEQLELSSPDFKGLRHESGDGSPRIRISHGSPSGKAAAEEGVFESSNVTYTGPQVSSTETRWGSGGGQTTTFIREGKERITDVRFKGPNFGLTVGKGQEGTDMSRGTEEQRDGSFQVSGTSMSLRDSTNTGNRHVTIGGLGSADIASTDENGGSITLPLPGKSMQISSTTIDKTQVGSFDTSVGERKNVTISTTNSSHPQTTGSGSTDTPNVRLSRGSTESDTELKGSRLGGTTITIGNVGSGFSSGPGKISVTGMDVSVTGSKLKGDRDVNLPSTKGEIKTSGICGDADISLPVTHGEVKKSELDIKGTDMQMKVPSANIEGSVVSVRLPEAESDFKEPEINSSIRVKVPKSDSKYKMEVKIPSLSGPDKDVSIKGSKMVEKLDATVSKADGEILAPKEDSEGLAINIDKKEGDLKMPHIKMTSFGAKAQSVDVNAPKADIKATESSVENTDVKIKGPMFNVQSGSVPKIKGDTKGLHVDIKGAQINITGPDAAIDAPTKQGQGLDVKLTKSDTDTTAPKVDIKSPGVDGGGPYVDMTGQKFTIPSTTVNVKAPQFDIKTSRVNVESPDVDIKVPKVDTDMKGPQGGSKIKMPSFGQKVKGADVDLPESEINAKTPKIDVEDHNARGQKMPDVNFKLEDPRVAGDIDASVPKIEVDIKEVNIKGPGVDSEDQKGGFKMPKSSISTFGITGSKWEGPEVDVGLPTAEVNVKAAKVNIKGKDVSPSGKLTGSKFKVPAITDPKTSMPDVDLSVKDPKLEVKGNMSTPKIEGVIKTSKVDTKGPEVVIKGPNVEGTVSDINLPKASIDVKAPNVNIKTPEIDIEGPDAKIKGPKVKIPTITGPKMPELDINLKGSKVERHVNVSNLEGGIKTPEMDIEGPDDDTEGQKGRFKSPNITNPAFGIKGPQVEGSNVDINLPKVDIDVKAPVVDIKQPDVDIEKSNTKLKGPKINRPNASVEIKGPEIDSEGPMGGFEEPKIKMSSFNIKGPKLGGQDIDINLSNSNTDAKAPKMEMKGPEF
ncbi:neuroblast differentiation-associated protein AHNAK-like, partial [Stegastes partitus]|uniref:Neuroblast differentiation-associated protein AHNAK-like n=1 Tax=Stegastes partitus TaxID=144197 RepID=A0A9Y4JSY7_9TELE